MDTLTHLLMGHAMGAAAASATPHGAAIYWAAVIGNSLPDLDVPVSLLVRRDVKLHRTLTHTIPGCLALSGVATVGLGLFFPEAPWLSLFGWLLLGTLVHLAMDCLNLFGARPFWPLTDRTVDLGALHILDPVLVVLLGIPAAGAAMGMTPQSLVALSFGLIWPYVLYRVMTARRLQRWLTGEGPSRSRVIPWYGSWRFLFETDHSIEFGCWSQGRRKIMQRFAKLDSPLVRATLAHPQVAAFLASAEYPYARIHEDENGNAVVWADALRQLRADFQPVRIKV